MTLLVQTKNGLKEVEVLSLFKAHDRVFFAHQSLDKEEFVVSDLLTGYRIAIGDTESEAISLANSRIDVQAQKETLIPAYAEAEAVTGIIRMNQQAVAREQLDEQDGFLVCPCIMECLSDESICRHRQLPYKGKKSDNKEED